MSDPHDFPRHALADEESTARLLRLAGPRSGVPVDRAARMRLAVYNEWRGGLKHRRHVKRAVAATSMLATAAMALFTLRTFNRPADMAPPPRVVGTIERVEGSGRLRPGDNLLSNHAIETDTTTRVAVRLASGGSARFDVRTQARLVEPSVVQLTAGAVYLDTSDRSDPLQIRTPYGIVRDIGTQFEVRLTDSAIRVRVRTGQIALDHNARTISAAAGEELTMGADGITTTSIAPHGEAWSWTAAVAPVLSIEGKSVASVLEHLSREHGWTLSYADAALGREADQIVLHGSIDGLTPEQALDVALQTSGLAYRLRNGNLVVFRVGS